MKDIEIYLLSFLTSAAGAWLIMSYGQKMGLLDIPNHRSSHQRIVPKCGGIGILMAFIAACLMMGARAMPALWIPALLSGLLGFWGGDLHKLTAKIRLLLQFCCAATFLLLSGSSSDMLWPIMHLFFMIFIVGTANFYNFMDGIDGIASVTGIIGFLLLSVFIGLNDMDEKYAVMCNVLAISCFGFLGFNFPRAKVFMGDIGSVFLGFVFACMVYMLSETPVDFLVMISFLSTFYFDELFTMLRRLFNHDSLLEPHRKHIYQLLVNELSIKHWKVSVLYGIIQLSVGFSIIHFGGHNIYFILCLYSLYIPIFTIASIMVCKMVAAK